VLGSADVDWADVILGLRVSERHGLVSGFGRWLLILARPGIGIKRWILVGVFGITFVSIGLAFALSVPVSRDFTELLRTITLSGTLDQLWRGVLVAAAGFGMMGVATYMMFRRLAFGARYSRGSGGIIESLASHRARSTGPRIVAIGGGTGLSILLRGLKQRTENVTAIVTTTDDGGSSGILRETLGIIPPGDARQCLIALSESEPLMEQLLSYRFSYGVGLEGHSLGNLLLAALNDITGDFHLALDAAADLFNVRGKVMPSSLQTGMRLIAKTEAAVRIEGESTIGHSVQRLDSIWIEPNGCVANPVAMEAIRNADAVVMGPGSLYTSILPNFLVEGMSDAVRKSRASKILVCNVATQHGETEHFQAVDHLLEFERHSKVTPTHFLVNKRIRLIPDDANQTPIEPISVVEGRDILVVAGDIGDDYYVTHHHQNKLAELVLKIIGNR
jgi:uncharacterized cofD-like protein